MDIAVRLRCGGLFLYSVRGLFFSLHNSQKMRGILWTPAPEDIGDLRAGGKKPGSGKYDGGNVT